MQKIIAFLMSIIMSLFSFIPGLAPADAYTQADWYAKIASEFGLIADEEGTTAIDACESRGIVVGTYKADKAVTNVVVAASLAVVANLDGAKDSKEAAVKAAVDAGIIDVDTYFFGIYKEVVISTADADKALDNAKKASIDNKRDVENGGVVADKKGDITDMSELTAADINVDEISYLSYEGNVKPFATNAQGEFEDQSLLDKLNISKTIGGVTIKAKAQDSGFDVSLSGSVKGINISKKYEVRNFDITTKFDGNLAEKKINEAYLLMDYDVNDITTVSGSIAASVAEKELQEGDSDMDFFQKVQSGVYGLTKGDDAEFPVFTYDVPIPNCPAITVGITAKVVITVDGMIQLVISSSETKGIEIINNKIRTISEAEGEKSTLTANANIEAKLSLFATVKCVNICIIDADITVGLGARITVTFTSDSGTYKLDIPCDFLFDVNVTYPNAQNLTIKGHVKMYGIVKIGVGNNSILSKIGLKKSWTLLDESNGTFLDKEFDIVKAA